MLKDILIIVFLAFAFMFNVAAALRQSVKAISRKDLSFNDAFGISIYILLAILLKAYMLESIYAF